MTDDDNNVIIEYTDLQAVEDGVLVEVNGEGGVNRVTRAVFDYFAKRIGSSPITGPVTDITPLMDAIRAMVKITPDEGGWRTGTYQGKELWLLPNEIGGLTLMFPEDYYLRLRESRLSGTFEFVPPKENACDQNGGKSVSSRQCCESCEVQVLVPPIACSRADSISDACEGNNVRSARM